MQVTLTIRSDADVHSRWFGSRREVDQEIVNYVNRRISEDGHYSNVDSAIEFLTLHGSSVRIVEYHPIDER